MLNAFVLDLVQEASTRTVEKEKSFGEETLNKQRSVDDGLHMDPIFSETRSM